MKRRERVMRCPNTDSVLYQALLPKDDKVAVDLEQCDECGGVLVSDFVLKSRADKDVASLHLADTHKFRILKEVRRTTNLPCPICGEEMEDLSDRSIPDNFIIAYCRISDAIWYNTVFIANTDPKWIENRAVSEVFGQPDRAEIMNGIMNGIDSVLVTPTMNPYDSASKGNVDDVADKIPRSHATNIIAVSEFIVGSMLDLPDTVSKEPHSQKIARPDTTHLQSVVRAGEKELRDSTPVDILIAPTLTAMRARDLLEGSGIHCSIDYDQEERKYTQHPRMRVTVSSKDEPRARVILSEAFRDFRINDGLK